MMKSKKVLIFSLILALCCATLPIQAFAVTLDEYSQPKYEATAAIDGVEIAQIGAETNRTGGVMINRFGGTTLAATVDVSQIKWFALEYENPTGAPWPFFWVFQQSGTHQQFTATADQPYKRYDAAFDNPEDANVQPGGAFAPANSTTGWIVVPASSIGATIATTLEAMYLTIPAGAENQINVTRLRFGRILGFTEENFEERDQAIVISDFTLYSDAVIKSNQTAPAFVSVTRVRSKATADRAIKSRIDGIALTQNAAIDGKDIPGGLMISLFAEGKTEASIADMKWIALEYNNPTGTAWPFIFTLQGNGKQTITGNNAQEYKILDSNFKVVQERTPIYSYVIPGINQSGWLLFPRAVFDQIDNIGDTLSAMYLQMYASNTSEDNVKELHFGRIVYYTQEEITDFGKGILVADLAAWSDADIALRTLAKGTGADGKEPIRITQTVKVSQQELNKDQYVGDARILEDFDLGYSTDDDEFVGQWQQRIYSAVGGLNLDRADGVSGNGLKFTIKEPRPDRPDDYACVTYLPNAKIANWSDWSNAEGVTFWVKNLSEAEISIGFEIDEYDPDQDVAADYLGERWSIAQGARIFLYDTNKDVQYLLTSYSTVDIPVGFEGWVRIPFSYFTKAAWCTWGNSTFDKARIAQVSISCNTVVNLGLSFVMDSMGTYDNKTAVTSMFFGGNESIPDNMGMKE